MVQGGDLSCNESVVHFDFHCNLNFHFHLEDELPLGKAGWSLSLSTSLCFVFCVWEIFVGFFARVPLSTAGWLLSLFHFKFPYHLVLCVEHFGWIFSHSWEQPAGWSVENKLPFAYQCLFLAAFTFYEEKLWKFKNQSVGPQYFGLSGYPPKHWWSICSVSHINLQAIHMDFGFSNHITPQNIAFSLSK